MDNFYILWVFLLVILFLLLYNKYHNGKAYLHLILCFKKRYEQNSRKRSVERIKSRCHTPDNTILLLSDVFFVAICILIGYVLMSKMIIFAAVMTGSMTGTVDKGDILMITTHGEIEVGDIIMFDAPFINYPVTHRVYEINSKGIITKGDAHEKPDDWIIQEKDIRGQAVTIFGKPVVIPDVGSYFIVGNEFDDTKTINTAYGDQYGRTKKLVNMIRSYGLVIFMVVLLYLMLDMFRNG